MFGVTIVQIDLTKININMLQQNVYVMPPFGMSLRIYKRYKGILLKNSNYENYTITH